ncbi:MAG: haloacid dehalogenase [Dehalococcoidia bacterium]|nr:haloacid dehalogenase [Dehalococcoidia bacterium]
MSSLRDELESVGVAISARMADKNAAREKALAKSRDVIRLSANAIRAVHRGELPRTIELLATAKGLLADTDLVRSSHPDIFYAGYLQDAQKEYAEACTTFALVSGEPLPGPEELGVGDAPYLNGLGETVGEIRRYLLDMLRRGEVDGCEALLRAMDDIYSLLVTIDYPDAMTGGLRRTTDNARGILERTRGDVTIAITNWRLERRLEALDDNGTRRIS